MYKYQTDKHEKCILTMQIARQSRELRHFVQFQSELNNLGMDKVLTLVLYV